MELIQRKIFEIEFGFEDLNGHVPYSSWVYCDSRKTNSYGETYQRTRSRTFYWNSTLNRFELTPVKADSSHWYKKIVGDFAEIENLITDFSLEQMAFEGTKSMILMDADATDDPLHGRQ